MDKLVMGIVGYGGMGTLHAKGIKEKVPQVQVKGVWDIRPEAREKAQADGLHPYGSLGELLADAEIELVTVATPNNFHRDIVIECLEAGKNVISEKPVAMNAIEMEEMMAAAGASGKLFSVHQNRRWDRDYRIVKKLLDEGTVGAPYFIESRVQGSRRAMHGWRGHKINGGGMVLDWGVHLLDQMLDLVHSPVTAVDAHLFQVFSEEVEDNIKILLRFENKVSALLEMSTNCFALLPRWHVSCCEGTVVVDNWKCEGRIVQLKEDAEMEWTDEIVYTDAGPTRTMAPRPEYTQTTSPLPEMVSDWTDYYHNIYGVLRSGEELLVKPEQALRVMKVIDLIFESDKVGHGLDCHI